MIAILESKVLYYHRQSLQACNTLRLGDIAMMFWNPVERHEHAGTKTGRTHQLRVHMSSIGFPIFGDTHYGGHFFSERDLTLAPAAPTDPLFAYQALHARPIKFRHPIKETPLTIEAPIPAQFQTVLDLLRAHRCK